MIIIVQYSGAVPVPSPQNFYYFGGQRHFQKCSGDCGQATFEPGARIFTTFALSPKPQYQLFYFYFMVEVEIHPIQLCSHSLPLSRASNLPYAKQAFQSGQTPATLATH